MSNPSLILPQSPAYGEDYVYAAQVEDGAVPLYNVLPLTFTRASGGTRINKDGLVQNMPYNLLGYSETFDNVVWSKEPGNTVTTNTTTSPNGTTTADTLNATATNQLNIYQTYTPIAGSYTYSVYLKKNGTNLIETYIYQVGVGFIARGEINFDNGTFTASLGTGSIENVGNGWFRVLLSASLLASTHTIGFYTTSSTGTRSTFAWGAQLNIGSTAQPYLATTDRLNMPRITYPVGGGCGALLLEKQSTNLLSYSNGFDISYWDKTSQGVGSNAVITPNYTTSPDGTNNAFRFQCNLNGGTTTNDRSWMLASFTAQTTSTISIYIKLNSAGTKTILFSDSGGNTKTISNTDWQRIDTTISGGSGEFRIGLIGSMTSDTLDCSIAFAQAEGSSYATSYIPTTSTSATRIADLCYKTDIGSYFGTNKGTFFWQGVTPYFVSGAAQYLLDISDTINFNLNRFALYMVASNTVQLYTSVTGGNNATLAQNSFAKIAIVWNGTSCSLYINGAVAINQTISNSNPTAFHLNSRYSLNENGNTQVGEVRIYNTNLSNAELIALTTL